MEKYPTLVSILSQLVSCSKSFGLAAFDGDCGIFILQCYNAADISVQSTFRLLFWLLRECHLMFCRLCTSLSVALHWKSLSPVCSCLLDPQYQNNLSSTNLHKSLHKSARAWWIHNIRTLVAPHYQNNLSSTSSTFHFQKCSSKSNLSNQLTANVNE